MKKTMTVGPLKKATSVETREVSNVIKSRISALTPNTIFEISGVSRGSSLDNVRSSVRYYANQANVSVYTKWSNDTLTVGLATPSTPAPVSKSATRKPATSVKFVPNKPTNSPVAKAKSKPVAKPVV